MALRKILTAIVVIAMASPTWGGAEALGNITSSFAATTGTTKLTTGSTVYSGDAISVDDHGTLQIAFTGGSQAEVIGNSRVRMTKLDGKIQMAVDQGEASFRTSGKSGMQALVSDITVRPANDSQALGVIEAFSETHAIVAAREGTLLVTTPFDDKTYTVHEGEAVELTASDDPQGGAIPAGKSNGTFSIHKKALIWTVVFISVTVALLAYFLTRNETRLPPVALQPQVSPLKID